MKRSMKGAMKSRYHSLGYKARIRDVAKEANPKVGKSIDTFDWVLATCWYEGWQRADHEIAKGYIKAA